MLKYPLGSIVKIKDDFSGGISWSAGYFGIIISYNEDAINKNMRDHYIIWLFRPNNSEFSINKVFAEHRELEFIK